MHRQDSPDLDNFHSSYNVTLVPFAQLTPQIQDSETIRFKELNIFPYQRINHQRQFWFSISYRLSIFFPFFLRFLLQAYLAPTVMTTSAIAEPIDDQSRPFLQGLPSKGVLFAHYYLSVILFSALRSINSEIQGIVIKMSLRGYWYLDTPSLCLFPAMTVGVGTIVFVQFHFLVVQLAIHFVDPLFLRFKAIGVCYFYKWN